MHIRLFETMCCTWFGSSSVLVLLIGVTNAYHTFPSDNSHLSDGCVHFHIVHTNDMHARFEQISQFSGACSKSDAKSNNCYGGFARIATLVRNARAGSIPALFLNAGDTYQGTLWFSVHKWKMAAKFLNMLEPDAISLGNHEFDNGVDGLVPFINNVTFPVLAANLNLTNEPELDATKLAKSTVVDVNGTQVGIIGYLTPETKFIPKTENVIFEDEVKAISEEAKRLKENGVHILIALGHSGFRVDKLIATQVEDIDLVIGAHSHSFLYNGTQPDSETPVDSYPTAITQSSGRIVYVVQAYAHTKYLGNLSVTFDSEGELTHIEGSPILVDSSIEQASDVLEELEKWREGISDLTSTVVGYSRVFLKGNVCYGEECNLGNLVTDAFVDYNLRQYTDSFGWTDAAIAIINSGDLKTSISTSANHLITMADVLAVFPFGNTVVKISMTGEKIRSMLEWSVYSLCENPTDLSGAFLQYSGIQVTYDLSKPPNSKLVSAKVRCANCSVPVFSDLNDTETYSVILTDYLYKGGHNYTMFSEFDYTSLGEYLPITIMSAAQTDVFDVSVVDIVIDYLGRHSPVYPAVEHRIIFSDAANAVDTHSE